MSDQIRLRVMLPTHVLVDEHAVKVLARGADGAFCVLPRHAGFVTALVPGILVYLLEDGTERFVATDEGVLVKVGNDVLVSTPNGTTGDELDTLRDAVDTELLELDEEARRARSALARLEASTLRTFLELERHAHV